LRRVVVDPGVLVSAIITPVGPPAEMLREIRRGRLAIVVSPHLLAELLGVLRRERFRRYVTIEEAESYVAGLAARSEMSADPVDVASITRDPSDDYLVALAREVSADAIVSGDADLLTLELATPPILSPRALVDQLARNR
jgi:putative PIN family toxin of toxin-antitoxin system